MGIYRPIIKRAQGSSTEKPATPPSSRLITVPTVITGTRVPLAIKASERIIRGEKYATPWVVAMAASDMEGTPGRLMDKYFPELELGSSEPGAKADVAADALAAFILAAAIMFGPKTSIAAKASTGLILGKEGVKTARFAGYDKDYRAALEQVGQPDQHISLPVTMLGKEAMVESLVGLVLAAATNDVENPYARHALGAASLTHAVAATYHGHQNQSTYDQLAADAIHDLQLAR